ncbi:hypothetical protein JCM16161A_23970 [Vulcanisaeta sp. JCM 16161]|uniref:hypothetical protein n=1 Tax=Vulcanisaeta sp. JCM 16161 TaxID=1295372 RepID=UPI0006D1BA6B|nr:hypothetical protein [Vulcanisaeta sp. JCM 16161]
MLSISQAKDIKSIVNELRSKGFSKLDIYLILRTLKPDAKFEYLLSPSELDLVNRVNGLRIELYRMRTELYDLERKVKRRHEIIMGVYDELMKGKNK